MSNLRESLFGLISAVATLSDTRILLTKNAALSKEFEQVRDAALSLKQNKKLSTAALSKKYEQLNEKFNLLGVQFDYEQTLKKVNPSKMKVSVPDDEGQTKLVIGRGGSREGSGRKKIGVTRLVKINLPKEEWEYIEELIRNEHVDSLAEYFRRIHYNCRR